MNSDFFSPLKHEPPSPELTLQQHHLLIGCLLADGGIQRFQTKNNALVTARFYEKHAPSQKDICDFLYHQLPFTEGITQPPKIVKSGLYAEVYTGKNLCFLPYLYNFYLHNNGHFILNQRKMIKRIPPTIGEFLTTSADLTMWLAGDGGHVNHGHDLILYTNSFSQTEHVLLQSALRQNFSIDAEIRPVRRESGKIEWTLCLPYQQALLFLQHCDPTILSQIPSLHSKFQVRGYGSGRAAPRSRKFQG